MEVTNSYVHVGSAYPTAGCDGGYFRHTNLPYFLNKCPECGGRLAYEEGDYSGADYTSPEGLFYCLRCDMDYSCISGKSHDSRGAYLIRTSKPQPKVETPKPPEDPIVCKKDLLGHEYLIRASHINHVKVSMGV